MLQNLITMTRLFKRERGQDMAEYSLLIGLITIIIVAATFLFGPAIAEAFNKITNSLAPLLG